MAKFCGKCGSNLDKTTSLCPNCDAEKINLLNQIEAKKRTNRRIVAFVLVGILLAAIVVGNFGCLGSRFGSKVKNAEDAITQAKKLGEKYGYKNAMSELSKKNETAIDGDTYYRLQQNYQGIPVYGRTVIYATDAHHAVTSVTGNALDVNENLDLTPQITADQARETILSYLAQEYDIGNAEDIDVEGINKNNLCIYNMGSTGDSRLAYCLNVCGYEFIVDAHNAEVLLANCLINTATVKGTLSGQTVKKGRKKYHTEYKNEQYLQDGAEFYLIDPARNIETYQAINKKQWEWSVLGTIKMLKDAELVKWTHGSQPDASAVDAYHNVKIAYDYFDQMLNNKSADGSGKAKIILVTGVEWFQQLINKEVKNIPISSRHAFSRTLKGAPDDSIITYLYFEARNIKHVSCAARLDVVAHEYAHSVERLHSDMLGNGESGAIKEALSDIFGELVEAWWNEDTPNWQNAYRNHRNPNSSKCAAKVNDTFWVNPNDLRNDDGGEHINSTVLSHAAYLMWNGIDGDENKKISNNELAKIWYRAMLMMPSDCNFKECRKLVELAASSLRLSKSQIQGIHEAFDAVGILDEKNVTIDYSVLPNCLMYILDQNGEPYDNYSIRISRDQYVGDAGGIPIYMTQTRNIRWQSDRPYTLPTQPGIYTVTVTDNCNENRAVTFKLNVSNDNNKKSLKFFTNFQKPRIVFNRQKTSNILEQTLDFSKIWQAITEYQEYTYAVDFVFKEDGRVYLGVGFYLSELVSFYSGTYTTDGNVVTITLDTDGRKFQYYWDGNKKQLEQISEEGVLSCHKIGTVLSLTVSEFHCDASIYDDFIERGLVNGIWNYDDQHY